VVDQIVEEAPRFAFGVLSTIAYEDPRHRDFLCAV